MLPSRQKLSQIYCVGVGEPVCESKHLGISRIARVPGDGGGAECVIEVSWDYLTKVFRSSRCRRSLRSTRYRVALRYRELCQPRPGCPVKIRSPGNSVTIWDRSAMILATVKIMEAVVPSWTFHEPPWSSVCGPSRLRKCAVRWDPRIHRW